MQNRMPIWSVNFESLGSRHYHTRELSTKEIKDRVELEQNMLDFTRHSFFVGEMTAEIITDHRVHGKTIDQLKKMYTQKEARVKFSQNKLRVGFGKFANYGSLVFDSFSTGYNNYNKMIKSNEYASSLDLPQTMHVIASTAGEVAGGELIYRGLDCGFTVLAGGLGIVHPAAPVVISVVSYISTELIIENKEIVWQKCNDYFQDKDQLRQAYTGKIHAHLVPYQVNSYAPKHQYLNEYRLRHPFHFDKPDQQTQTLPSSTGAVSQSVAITSDQSMHSSKVITTQTKSISHLSQVNTPTFPKSHEHVEMRFQSILVPQEPEQLRNRGNVSLWLDEHGRLKGKIEVDLMQMPVLGAVLMAGKIAKDSISWFRLSEYDKATQYLPTSMQRLKDALQGNRWTTSVWQHPFKSNKDLINIRRSELLQNVDRIIASNKDPHDAEKMHLYRIFRFSIVKADEKALRKLMFGNLDVEKFSEYVEDYYFARASLLASFNNQLEKNDLISAESTVTKMSVEFPDDLYTYLAKAQIQTEHQQFGAVDETLKVVETIIDQHKEQANLVKDEWIEIDGYYGLQNKKSVAFLTVNKERELAIQVKMSCLYKKAITAEISDQPRLFKEMQDFCSTAIAENPKNINYRRLIVKSFAATKQYEQAIVHQEVICQSSFPEANEFLTLARLYDQAGNIDSAILHYNNYLNKTENIVKNESQLQYYLHQYLRDIYLSKKQFEKALAEAKKVCVFEEHSAVDESILSELQSKWLTANELMRNPNLINEMLNDTRSSIKKNDIARAKKQARAILKLDPDNKDAQAILDKIYYEQSIWLDAINKALQLMFSCGRRMIDQSDPNAHRFLKSAFITANGLYDLGYDIVADYWLDDEWLKHISNKNVIEKTFYGINKFTILVSMIDDLVKLNPSYFQNSPAWLKTSANRVRQGATIVSYTSGLVGSGYQIYNPSQPMMDSVNISQGYSAIVFVHYAINAFEYVQRSREKPITDHALYHSIKQTAANVVNPVNFCLKIINKADEELPKSIDSWQDFFKFLVFHAEIQTGLFPVRLGAKVLHEDIIQSQQNELLNSANLCIKKNNLDGAIKCYNDYLKRSIEQIITAAMMKNSLHYKPYKNSSNDLIVSKNRDALVALKELNHAQNELEKDVKNIRLYEKKLIKYMQYRPDDPSVHQQLAAVNQYRNNTSRAESCCTTAIKLLEKQQLNASDEKEKQDLELQLQQAQQQLKNVREQIAEEKWQIKCQQNAAVGYRGGLVLGSFLGNLLGQLLQNCYKSQKFELSTSSLPVWRTCVNFSPPAKSLLPKPAYLSGLPKPSLKTTSHELFKKKNAIPLLRKPEVKPLIPKPTDLRGLTKEALKNENSSTLWHQKMATTGTCLIATKRQLKP